MAKTIRIFFSYFVRLSEIVWFLKLLTFC